MKNGAEDIQKEIVAEFPKMRTQEDLLALLNRIKQMLVGSVEGETCKPLTMSSLNYYKNVKVSLRHRYHLFTIKKKSGKLRQICAPVAGLKIIQSCIREIFNAYYEPSPNVCGFVSGRSIADGAKRHVGKNYVLNIDLKDFFDSIEYHRVKAMLCCAPFNMKDDKENPQSLPFVIANLCCTPKKVIRVNAEGKEYECIRSVLPQGAPTSPILTNLICRKLDKKLFLLSKKYHCAYSRYADDITFSGNKNIFKPDSEFFAELKQIVEVECRVKINEDKTRVQSRKYRQEVTGLVVNKKVNVTKRYVKQIRMWLYLWETDGYEKAQSLFIHDYLSDKGHVKPATAHMENVIGGKLDYLKMIVGDENHAYYSLRSRYDNLIKEITQADKSMPIIPPVAPQLDLHDGNKVPSDDSNIIEIMEWLIDNL